jgi:hypothetical protein
MVRGIETFKAFFKDYPDSYVIIGGTACDTILEEAGFTPRATRDIDLIVIIEALKPAFGQHFWKFILEGNYARKEKSADERNYYRFTNPENPDFPKQIELFSRVPEAIALDNSAHLTPIPLDDDLSSLSAILLSDDYYHYMITHSKVDNGLRIANTEALICLKAKAFLEITERIANGSREDAKHIRKHKEDIFRLAVLLTADDNYMLPETVKAHMETFVNSISNELPDKKMFDSLGFPGANAQAILDQLISSFNLNVNPAATV